MERNRMTKKKQKHLKKCFNKREKNTKKKIFISKIHLTMFKHMKKSCFNFFFCKFFIRLLSIYILCPFCKCLVRCDILTE